ncbi:glycosyltransferase family 39 protein [Acidobacteria bacterium AH-259-G07]|nr:glycosyltransferase family 39 protein [Acidobacteria bacterium AH-259-G07]
MLSRRVDFLVVPSLVAIGAVFRFWRISDLGLTHFDEGSYAMAGKWLATFGNEGWAIQAGHAPALFPILVGLFFSLFGIRDYLAIAVSAAVGSATIGLIYLIGRHWLSRETGVLAALFLATCEYHLTYSRLALTDVTFTFLFWAALGALLWSVQREDRRWAIIGGLLTGLCWNTKYHGFFPLIITGCWLALSRFFTASSRSRPWLSLLKRSHLGTAAALALLAYIPWALLVQITVGYWSILRGQLSHSLGFGEFAWTTPSAIYFYLSHWLTAPLLICAVFGFVFILIDRKETGLFLATVFVLFTASTLFYMSFPRLILPIVPAICLFSGFGVKAIAGRIPFINPKIIVGFGTATVLLWNLVAAGPVLALRTDSYREAARYLQNFEEPVVTQLSKNYYFYEERKSLEIRWQELDDLDSLMEDAAPVIIAVDPIIHRLPEDRAWLEKHRPRLSLLRSFEVTMYEPVYYQGFNPTLGFETLPRSVVPAVPGDTRIDVYKFQKQP